MWTTINIKLELKDGMKTVHTCNFPMQGNDKLNYIHELAREVEQKFIAEHPFLKDAPMHTFWVVKGF